MTAVSTRVEKLLALAFDAAAAENEAIAAFLKAKDAMAGQGGWFGLKQALAPAVTYSPPPPQPAEEAPAFPHWRFPFGKHKGRAVADVFEDDSGYLAWLIKAEVKIPHSVRQAIRRHVLGEY